MEADFGVNGNRRARLCKGVDECAKQCAQWREVAMCESRGKGLRPQSRPELQGVDARRRAATKGTGEVNSPPVCRRQATKAIGGGSREAK